MDPEILARYAERRVPRYTTYPTAPNFIPAVGESAYRSWLAALPERSDVSVYVHVPFRIDGWISFEEVAEAHRRLEEGGLFGKFVLCPDLPFPEIRH